MKTIKTTSPGFLGFARSCDWFVAIFQEKDKPTNTTTTLEKTHNTFATLKNLMCRKKYPQQVVVIFPRDSVYGECEFVGIKDYRDS